MHRHHDNMLQCSTELYLSLPKQTQRRLVHSMLGMSAGMQKHQALHQQSPPESGISQLQPGQFAAGQVLDDHALASICTLDMPAG